MRFSWCVLLMLAGCSRARIPEAELRSDGPRGVWFAREHQRRGLSVQVFMDDGVVGNLANLRAGDRIELEGKKDRYELVGAELHLQIAGTELKLPYASGTDEVGPWFDTGRRFRPLRRATHEQLARSWYRDPDGAVFTLAPDDASWSNDGYLLKSAAGAGLAGLTENDELVFNRQLFRSQPRGDQGTSAKQ